MQIIPKRVFLKNNALHSFPRVCAILFIRDQNACEATYQEIFKLKVLWGGSSFFFASFSLILFSHSSAEPEAQEKNQNQITLKWLFNALMCWNQPISQQKSLRHQLFTCNFFLWTSFLFFSFIDSLDFNFPYSKFACSQEFLLQWALSHAGQWGRITLRCLQHFCWRLSSTTSLSFKFPACNEQQVPDVWNKGLHICS